MKGRPCYHVKRQGSFADLVSTGSIVHKMQDRERILLATPVVL